MGIKIGDNNKISNSTIANTMEKIADEIADSIRRMIYASAM